MKYTRYGIYTERGTSLSVGDTFDNIFDLEDAIEVAKDGKDLVAKIKLIKSYLLNPVLDHESPSVIRIKGNDVFGNNHYLKIIL